MRYTLLFVVLCVASTPIATLGRKLAQSVSSSNTYPDPSLANNYVEIIDGDFFLGCSKFPIAGFNQWELLEAGAAVPTLTGSQLDPSITGPELIRSVLDTAAKSGFTVVRAWVHAVSQQYAATNPGEYLEDLFKGLDYALDESRKRGIKVLLSFTSNWTPAGGVDSFANATGVTHNEFFTDAKAKQLYKDYVKGVLTRVNSINGLTYFEDPTIFGWNLINEPVCRGCGSGTIATWVKEMAAFVKSLDSNHLLTVGEEGMWSTTGDAVGNNPMAIESAWATEYTQDFNADHSDPNIDFAAFHAWPDLWVCNSGCENKPQPVSFLSSWIAAHIKQAGKIGKPLLLEEFGKKDGRDDYFKAAYTAVESSLKSGGPLKGALFWQFYAAGQQASKGEGGGSGQSGIYEGDTAFQLAQANAQLVKTLSSSVPSPAGRCSKKGPSPQATTQNCPKGFEGVSCSIDINECARGTHTCGKGSQCINTQGGFTCVCPLGTTGDAYTTTGCTRDTVVLSKALEEFWNDGDGQACDQGEDIAYPDNAPGWVEDSAGVFARDPDRKGLFGARTPVSAEECAIACKGAEGCTAFTYNNVTKGCFLKAGQCPNNNGCQQPEQICSSVNDMGKVIQVSCGKWSTYYLNTVKAASDDGACKGA